MALIFLIVGIVLAAFSIQKSYTEENTLNKWDGIRPSTITQDLGPSWTLGMPEESFFELNVSTSDAVRVKIGTPILDENTEEIVLTNLIFNQVGTRFTQRVAVGKNGTYQVEVKNEGITPVDIWGNVFAKKIVTIYQTFFPYLSLGTLVVLGGLASLIYGVLTKPKKRRRKRRL